MTAPPKSRYDVGVIVNAPRGKLYEAAVSMVRRVVTAERWTIADHHQSHALGALYDSPWYHRPSPEQGLALVLSFDGRGNDGCFNAYLANSRGDSAGLVTTVVTKRPLALGLLYKDLGSMLPHFWTGTNRTRSPCEASPLACERLPGIMMAYAGDV